MLTIGITGGIGSGKTTVCRIFAALGVPVYDSDTNAKMLMTSDTHLREGLKHILGQEAYKEGQLNRTYIADRIFRDRALLAQVNALVHPAVKDDFKAWANDMTKRGAPYVIQENAILFEGGFDADMDLCVTISAPIEQRIERTSSRNNISPDQVRERIANQISDSEREKKADYTIINEDEDMVLPQVLKLHDIFTAKTK